VLNLFDKIGGGGGSRTHEYPLNINKIQLIAPKLQILISKSAFIL
jgi:hypothetical protein